MNIQEESERDLRNAEAYAKTFDALLGQIVPSIGTQAGRKPAGVIPLSCEAKGLSKLTARQESRVKSLPSRP